MSQTPALDEKRKKQRKEALELCGKNRGAHDYIPIEWMDTHDAEKQLMRRRVTRLLCRVCFTNVEVAHLVNNYPEVTL